MLRAVGRGGASRRIRIPKDREAVPGDFQRKPISEEVAQVGYVVERGDPVLSSDLPSCSRNAGPVPTDPGALRQVRKGGFPRGRGGTIAAPWR